MPGRILMALTLAIPLGAVLVAQNPQPPRPQQLPPGTATVTGTAVVLGTNQPIAGASVEMRKLDCNMFTNAPEVLSAITGTDGKFAFNNVRAGGWCLVATVPGGKFTPAEFMQRGILGRGVTLPVADGQKVDGIQLALAPTGGISGRVIDSDGEPLAFARVQVLEAFYQEGQRRLYILQVTQTNDRGEYRFYWLPPRRYYLAVAREDTRRPSVVSVQPPPGTGGRREDVMPPVVVSRISPRGELVEETYRVVYYPSETDPQRAMPIDIPPGGSVGGVDLVLNAGRVRAFHVRGTVVNSVLGKPAAGAQVRLVPRDWASTVIMPGAVVDSNGDFDVRGVAPGSYVLYANQSIPDPAAPPSPAPAAPGGAAAPTPPPIPLGARLFVNIGSGDVDNVKLTLVQSSSLQGRVLIEGAPAANIPQGVAVTLARDPDLVGIPSPPGRGIVQPDGTFTMRNVGPGEYRVYVSPFLTAFQWGNPNIAPQLQNGYVKAIRMGATDVLTDGLRLAEGAGGGQIEIVLGSGGRLNGSVANSRGEPAVNVTVALVPELNLRRRLDLYRFVTTNIAGGFEIQGIAPGSYRAFAWEEVERDAWQNPEFIKPFEGRGTPVEIREATPASVDLLAIPAR